MRVPYQTIFDETRNGVRVEIYLMPVADPDGKFPSLVVRSMPGGRIEGWCFRSDEKGKITL